MKKAIIICSFWFLVGIGHSQYVTIPDTAFVSWLQNNGYATCFNGNQLDTTCSAILNADTLKPIDDSISNLWGIQFFKNLVYLNCSSNYLNSLPELPVALTYLGCYNNNINSLPILPEKITYLICYNNKIVNLPSHLPDSLIKLDCSINILSALPQLPESVTYLNCSSNQIDSLPALPPLLSHLDIDVNNIRALPTIPPYLKYLICNRNPLDSFPFLPSHLFELTWGGYPILVLPKLPVSLKILSCVNAYLDSLPQLPDSLTDLSCDDNYLIKLPSLPSTLTNLSCIDNHLTFIPPLPDSLYNFGCSYNPQLSCLPKLKRIVSFGFNNTSVTCLPNYGNITYSYPSLSTVPLCEEGNLNGCSVYTYVKSITDMSNLSIYPNPATTKLEIEFQNVTCTVQMSVLDISGKLIKEENVNGVNQMEIDVSALSAGMYFLQVQGGGESVVKKFVKE